VPCPFLRISPHPLSNLEIIPSRICLHGQSTYTSSHISNCQKISCPIADKINGDTLSLAISLYKEYRNYGIGTALMKQMLNLLKQEGYFAASLSVQKENYAVKMYKNVGFEVVHEKDEEYIMMCMLHDNEAIRKMDILFK